MPSSISFLPAPAPATAPSSSSSGPPSAEADVSFDAALTQAAPSPAKSGQPTSVTGLARAHLAAGKMAKAEKAEKSAKAPDAETSSAGAGPTLLNAEELAALLALIGAPVALQQPPPPAAPADFNLTSDTRTPDSADAPGESTVNFSAHSLTTGKDRDVFIARSLGAQNSDTKSGFTLDSAAAGDKLTPRDLLKQGIDVISYQLSSAAAGTVHTALMSAAAPLTTSLPDAPSLASRIEPPPETLVTPEIAATTPAPAAPEEIPATSLAPASTEAAALNLLKNAAVPVATPTITSAANGMSDATQLLKNASMATGKIAAVEAPSLRALAPQKASPKTGSEKIAASTGSRELSIGPGVNSSIEASKNKFLSIDAEQLTTEAPALGTSTANWGDSMNPDARSTPIAARLLDDALASVGTSPASLSNVERSQEASPPKAASASQAAQIVSEIRDIADGLWAVERNSVEVRFNFSETERLSVKVEYRDGVVKTTFRTDSPELRDTIAREWQSQIASSSDSRPYRVADPIFNTPPADARGFSLGGDSSRQQRQAEQSGNAPHIYATTTGRGQSSSSVAAAPASTFTRPDTAIHLHAFA